MKIPKPNHSTTSPHKPPAASRRDGQKVPPYKNTHITINIGAITTVVASLRRHLFTRRAMSIIGVLLVIIASYTIVSLVRDQDSSKNEAITPSSQVVENLEYQTVLPTDKAISKLGGWRQISPPGGEPVYAYTDTISGVAINVSQQPLPHSFKDNVDTQIADMAKKFNATTKLDADGTKVYVGTSAKGPQSVIFTKNGLLILIKSQRTITDSAWIQYIRSLN